MQKTTLRENTVEEAIYHSLAAYCAIKENKINSFKPYANQQNSEELDEYCVDLIHVLDDCALLLLEVKEKIANNLPRFTQSQHNKLERLEEWLPVYYAYNGVDRLQLPNLDQKRGWAVNTLKAILVSIPSALPDSTPNSSVHTTLYHLVETVRGGGGGTPPDGAWVDRFRQFGILLDETVIPEILTNWFLLLVYKGDKLFFLTGADLVNFYHHLKTMALRPNNDMLVQALARLESDPFIPNTLAVIASDADSADPGSTDSEDNKLTGPKM